MDNFENEINVQKEIISTAKKHKKFLKKRKRSVNDHDYFFPLIDGRNQMINETYGLNGLKGNEIVEEEQSIIKEEQSIVEEEQSKEQLIVKDNKTDEQNQNIVQVDEQKKKVVKETEEVEEADEVEETDEVEKTKDIEKVLLFTSDTQEDKQNVDDVDEEKTKTIEQESNQFTMKNPRDTEFDFKQEEATVTAKIIDSDRVFEIEAIERVEAEQEESLGYDIEAIERISQEEILSEDNHGQRQDEEDFISEPENIIYGLKRKEFLEKEQQDYIDSLGDTVINIHDLHKEYGNKKVLKGINLTIREGEKISIVGANGAGKSTLVEIISMIKPITSGKIDYAYGTSKSDISKNIGIQFQEATYPFYYRTIDIIKFFSDATKSNLSKSDIEQLMVDFQLEGMEKMRASALSGGQRQRLSILLAVLNSPKLLILDELSNGLDVEARSKIKLFIKEYLEKHNSTMLMVSHNPEEIEFLAKRMIIIYDGKIYKDLVIKDVILQWGSVEKYLDYVFLEEFNNIEGKSINFEENINNILKEENTKEVE